MHFKKMALLLIACLACVMLLTACHSNNDPWPASGGGTLPADNTVDANVPATAPDTVPETEPEPTQVENLTVPSETVAPGING